MAGRGRGRYGERDGPLRRPGEPAASPPTVGNVNIATLIAKVNDINIFDIDPLLLHETELMFRRLFRSGEDVKDVLSSLHSEAINNSDFGEKLVVALLQVCTFEVDKVCVRSQLLTCIQKDHEMKETMCQSDGRKFANAATFLGSIYNVFKVGRSRPVEVLGNGLLDYLELIIKNKDETHFKVLVTQVILNGNHFMSSESTAKRFESLKHSLRKILTAADLSTKAKCWILLSIDCLSNNLKPLTEGVRDFYVESLGDDFICLEGKLKGTSTVMKSPKHQKSQNSTGSEKLDKSEELFEVVNNLSITNQESKEKRNVTKTWKAEQELFSSRHGRYEQAKLRAKKDGGEGKVTMERPKSPKCDDDFYGIQIDKRGHDNG